MTARRDLDSAPTRGKVSANGKLSAEMKLDNAPPRMILISNRPPIVLTVRDRKVRLQESVGGLATGLSAYLRTMKGQSNHLWIGAPNAAAPRISKEFEEQARQTPRFPLAVQSVDGCNRRLGADEARCSFNSDRNLFPRAQTLIVVELFRGRVRRLTPQIVVTWGRR